MVKRVAVALAMGMALLGATLPSGAAAKKAAPKPKIITYTYRLNYTGSTMGAVIFTTNPEREYSNPSDSSNPYDDILGQGRGLEPTYDQALDSQKGSPLNKDLLDGTPADQKLLKNSPAKQEIAGVQFSGYRGTPVRLKVEDASGFPVPWVAAQCYNTAGFCEDRARSAGCGTVPAGRRLAGFKPARALTVWILTNNSSAQGWGTGECDGPATTGTITLITELTVKKKK